MSPLWRDEVGMYLAPRRLCLVRMGRGLKPALVHQEDHPNSASGYDWEGALASCEAYLSKTEWSNARLRVVVADAWARYTVVPWSDALNSTEEHKAHARELMASVFGGDLSEWSLSVSDAAPGVARLACAIPSGLLGGLNDLAPRHGLTLLSVQPQLIASFNSWRYRLPTTEAAWFVTVAEGSLAALRMCADGVDRVHAVRIGADWGRELKRLQIFGRLANANQAGRVFVDVPQSMRLQTEASPGLEWLDEPVVPLTTLHQLEQVRRRAA